MSLVPCRRLGVFDTGLYHGTVSLERLKQFFCHTLTQALTYNPVLEASDAIRMQRDWCFAKTWPHLTTLYRKLFVLFGPEELTAHLRQVLETHEVNWQNVLSCVSTLLVCQPDTQQHLKGLLAKLLINAFESYELESIITAFLLARQASLEGPAVFISYSEWFKISFGSPSSYHGGSKKALVFLLKFLTDLVPFEPAPYLKIHMLYPPYVGPKYRLLLMEYISLAKTRLLDLQVSGNAASQLCYCSLRDVEKALVLFENSRKIPAGIMEASIFRRPYYMSRFLPALLTPRVLPQLPDLRMGFIESLKKADKIPANMYTSYIHACEEEKQQWLEELLFIMSIGLPLQGEWASLFVRTLCGHRRVLRAVLTRVLHLISHQGPSLSDSHILGLAAFAVHVHISQSFLPLVDSMDQEEKSGVKAGVFFSKHLTQFLSCTTGQSLTFCMSLILYRVFLVLLTSELFTVLLQFLYVLPRLIPASRAEQGEVTESMWPNLTSPDLNWTSAALSAFKHSQFKEQDYQHWVCYQHYLPSPCSAGGCGGDLETMCRTIINTLMDFIYLHITQRFSLFQGLLSACADCEEADHVLAAFLNECRARCPLLLLSAAWWWPRLEPVLVTQWKRFSEASLPRELQRLAEDHCWANRLLSGTVDDPPSDAPWILGAFLYFTFRRENRLWGLETVMRKICAENEQVNQTSEQILSSFDPSLHGSLKDNTVRKLSPTTHSQSTLKYLKCSPNVKGAIQNVRIIIIIIYVIHFFNDIQDLSALCKPRNINL
uniref:Fanconi anemia group A protein-like n=1 Tax=Callorhinchus milii TaxID=7868 RepID=A0A4W3J2L8_CALMI